MNFHKIISFFFHFTHIKMFKTSVETYKKNCVHTITVHKNAINMNDIKNAWYTREIKC